MYGSTFFIHENEYKECGNNEGEKIDRLPQSKLGVVVNIGDWLFNPMAFEQPSIMTFWLKGEKEWSSKR